MKSPKYSTGVCGQNIPTLEVQQIRGGFYQKHERGEFVRNRLKKAVNLS
jgi:hypothetical protein